METAAQQEVSRGGVGDSSDPVTAVPGPDVGARETAGGSVRREPGPLSGGERPAACQATGQD